ncbi:septal ring lytic transglycosylase RlpA family protein [Aquirufa rosea]|uniref:Probable endolytic peptidoglycan transglycosylase RlpA n=1 Tax=Aquirufa rosea TaxID=2509241 RepID=A0A4Q1C208_9BACT|nr:septal ring lytic transglycosylase RlpA family protein [Aquirufa rosea]RXK52159.1 septal ring lytic transglycosylase RlpA family protein [Aquirufa rosea]
MTSIRIILFLLFYYSTFQAVSQNLGDESYGIASYYSRSFYNKKTANSEVLKRKEFTAAHRVYPFNTLVEVTNLQNKKSVIVRINDRGPYKSGRIIDLTEISAKQLNIRKVGLTKVRLKIIGFENEQMLIPYQYLEMETSPKFSTKYYQKTRLKYNKKYRLKRHIRHRSYLKKGRKKGSKVRQNQMNSKNAKKSSRGTK